MEIKLNMSHTPKSMLQINIWHKLGWVVEQQLEREGERVFIVIYYVYRLFILRVCCSVAFALACSLIDLPASVSACMCVYAWLCVGAAISNYI